MRPIHYLAAGITLIGSVVAAWAFQADERRTTDVRVEGNVVRPARLEPTNERREESLSAVGGAVHGSNHTSAIGYFGPKLLLGDPAHRYHFQVFALNWALDLPSGFSRQSLLSAMRGYVLAHGELVGTCQR
jgi:phosphatidylethanolamine-binding protein (PEBP) family uncharacterized protein